MLVDVRVHHDEQEKILVSMIIPQERDILQTVEQVVEVHVPMTQEKMPTSVVNHHRHHYVEQ